ncbi:MAG TPA: NIPSNAP family protein [Lacunisphaera sp.]|nr:NIPSNAP family protein [Lacunisphaera sp.]
MKTLVASFLCVLSFAAPAYAAVETPPKPVYELRIYHVLPGRMPNMLTRFRDHTCRLFEKHDMVNVGYWLPVEAKDQDKLYYVLRHASREAAKASWKAFVDDPAWHAVRDASEADGKIVSKVESTYLAQTDYSPAVPALEGSHVYELRTYVCNEGKLAELDARFRNHTLKLFEKHGMINLPYWHPTDADKGAGKTLVYLLAHDSVAAARKSFDSFRADPEWIKVRDASEAAGKILVQPPASVFLKPVDFSKLQ